MNRKENQSEQFVLKALVKTQPEPRENNQIPRQDLAKTDTTCMAGAQESHIANSLLPDMIPHNPPQIFLDKYECTVRERRNERNADTQDRFGESTEK